MWRNGEDRAPPARASRRTSALRAPPASFDGRRCVASIAGYPRSHPAHAKYSDRRDRPSPSLPKKIKIGPSSLAFPFIGPARYQNRAVTWAWGEIEAGLAAGMKLKEVWEAARKDGIDTSYDLV